MSYPIAAGDEAGDIGFRFGRGSSDYFVYSFVLTQDADRLRSLLAQVKSVLGWRQQQEFKFHQMPEAARIAFFDHVRQAPFVARSLIVDKRHLSEQLRQLSRYEMYGMFVGWLLACLPSTDLGGTRLILDDLSNSQKIINAIRHYLHAHGVHSVRRIGTRQSKSEALIQLADMCSGSVLRELSTGDRFHAPVHDRFLVWRFQEKNRPS